MKSEKRIEGQNCSRRDFLGTAAAIAGMNITGCGKRKEKPNLLFIWTDEHRAQSTGYACGNPALSPSLDALALQGAVFE